jgi:mono/diheme cytochrome c family protein
VLASSLLMLGMVFAYEVPALYQGADLKLGEQLMAEHQCAACHQRKVGGDGNAIYRPAGKVNSLSALRGMVESCNQQLDFRLFPEEVTSISAVLNRDHYRFK